MHILKFPDFLSMAKEAADILHCISSSTSPLFLTEPILLLHSLCSTQSKKYRRILAVTEKKTMRQTKTSKNNLLLLNSKYFRKHTHSWRTMCLLLESPASLPQSFVYGYYQHLQEQFPPLLKRRGRGTMWNRKSMCTAYYAKKQL